MCRNGLIVLAAALLVSGCMTRRAHLDQQIMPSGPDMRTTMVSEIVHDAQGRPLFDRVLADRPARTGEHYTIVAYDGEKPVRSFDIVLVPHEPADAAKPFRVIYEWTMSGYRFSVRAGEEPPRPANADPIAASLSPDPLIKLASAVSMTVGGFIVGLVASVPAAVLELGNVPFSSQEMLVSYTDYCYDGRGRLATSKMYLPSDRTREIIGTEFLYEGQARDPFRAEIRSLADGSVRIVP